MPLSLLFSELKSAISLRIFSYERCSSPFIIMALYYSLSNMSMYLFLYWGVQNWDQHSRCGFPSVKWRGRITSLSRLPTLPWMQPQVLLDYFVTRAHWWLVLNLVSTRTPRSFSAKLLTSWSTPLIYQWMWLFLLRCRLFDFPLLNFTIFC